MFPAACDEPVPPLPSATATCRYSALSSFSYVLPSRVVSVLSVDPLTPTLTASTSVSASFDFSSYSGLSVSSRGSTECTSAQSTFAAESDTVPALSPPSPFSFCSTASIATPIATAAATATSEGRLSSLPLRGRLTEREREGEGESGSESEARSQHFEGSTTVTAPSACRSTCVLCRQSKVRCDGATPCNRCVRLHKAHQCEPAAVRRKRKQTELEGGHAGDLTQQHVDAARRDWMAAVVQLPRCVSRAEHASILEQIDPLGAFTAPLDSQSAALSVSDSTRLSRWLLRHTLQQFHRDSQQRPTLRDTVRPLASMVSRWLAYARYASLLCPADLTSLLHGSAYINSVPVKQEAGGGKSLLRLHERTDRAEDGRCDGRVCGGFCLGPRKLLVHKPVRFVFTASPTEPLADTDFNNFACLVVQHRPSSQLHSLQRLVETDYNIDSQWSGEVVDYSTEVRVNWPFERLFGWSQRQVRAMYLQRSFLALYQLICSADWGRVVGAEVSVELGTCEEYEGAYQFRARCRHRTGLEFDCLIHRSFERDADGVVVKSCYTFISLTSTALSV